MDMIKWIRKNNRKIMVFVVIFSMVSFVIGSYGIQILVSLFGGGNQLYAEFDGHKIKSTDYFQAQNELKVLQMLSADRLRMGQNAGLSGPLLVHMLFRDSQLTGDLPSQLKQAAQQGQLPLSIEKIEAYFGQTPERPEILWILLKAEAYRAGFLIPTESARLTLQGIIPQISGNQIDYTGLIAQLIRSTNLSEDQILRTFADLMSILSYAGNVMNNQAVTINQVRADVARSQERIDAEFVKLSAADFVDPNAAVSEADLQKQFDAYKNVSPNQITNENPFGFGYKLPKRVQLEYLILPMDDVKKIIEKPTAEAAETFYSTNIAQYRSEVPSDPNNPDSEKVTKTQPFSEVESSILRNLEEQKMTTLASQIFIEARELTEKEFQNLNFDEATAQQIQMAAGDYQAAAKQLQEKYKIPVLTGKTGLLGPEQFAQKSILNTLSMQQRQNYLRLAELAFAVTEEKAERQRIGMPATRVWANIGPFTGGFYSEQINKYQRLMALVRVVDIEEPAVPESLDTTYAVNGIRLFDAQPEEESTFSVKEQVKKDLQIIRAMETVKARAEELAQLAKDQGWEKAEDAYNAKYAKKTVKVETLTQQQRFSPTDIALIKRHIQENPISARRMQTQLNNGMLTNLFYELLPAEAESTGTLQQVIPFEPQASFYVVKSVVRKPATIEDYLENKAMTALQMNASDAAGLALIHFSTDNILKRMKYEQKNTSSEGHPQHEEKTLPSGEII
jgi:hypothetical protein